MKEYRSIQYLRGLAATMVVIYHLAQPLGRMGYTGDWPTGLSGGVDIFFVISGFVMWMTTRTRAIGPVEFWRKRIVRIVPLYWLITTFMLAVLLVAPSAMQTSVFSLRHVVASYLFWPALNPGKPAMEPLVFAGWTLNYEMFFYLIFGLFLLARPAARLWGTVAVLALLVAAGAAFAVPRLSVAGFYTHDIVLEFAFGLLLGEATLRLGAGRLTPALSKSTLAACAWLLLGVSLAAVLSLYAIFPTIPWSIAFGLPATAVVAGGLLLEECGLVREWAVPHLLGNASYSIYLTQLISMAAVFAGWRKLHLDRLPLALPLFGVVDVAAALVVGILCYRLVERPLTRLFHGNTRRRMPDVEGGVLAAPARAA